MFWLILCLLQILFKIFESIHSIFISRLFFFNHYTKESTWELPLNADSKLQEAPPYFSASLRGDMSCFMLHKFFFFFEFEVHITEYI